jgi:hypothetical protein
MSSLLSRSKVIEESHTLSEQIPLQEVITMTAQHLIYLRDRIQRPVKPVEPGGGGDDDGPKRPDVTRPDTRNLVRRMRRVDKDQSRRYRQRTGE